MSKVDGLRGTGGNQFIGPNATRADLMRTINDQLGDLHEWAEDSGQYLDIGDITIVTERIPSGNISVTVMADLKEKTDAGS